MEIIVSPDEMSEYSRFIQKQGKSVALVPTMGALHEGHLSLCAVAKQRVECAVMSIFVNPTQFGPQEDFSKYPRPFDVDCAKAKSAGCDIVFAPAKDAMYPQGYATYVTVESITDRLCGKSRPGHFRGVTTVVLKLFNIVNPQVAIFGQKDAQQVLVIKRMVKDLNHPVQIEVAPIIRESDGLAMSSRNVYLTPDERVEAPVIFRSLSHAVKLCKEGVRESSVLRSEIKNMITASKYISIEYAEIVDTDNLSSPEHVPSPALIAIACRTSQSGTRLIDNVVVGGTL